MIKKNNHNQKLVVSADDTNGVAIGRNVAELTINELVTVSGTIGVNMANHQGLTNVFNNGSISGTGAAIIDRNGPITIYNNGVITGDIYLGNGNDQFRNSVNATLEGAVYGGKGRDGLWLESGNTQLIEKANGGRSDYVYSANSHTLGANVEILKLIGDLDANATGNMGANRITGNSGDNVLTGLGGKDIFIFSGKIGHDTIADFQDGIDTLRVVASSWSDLEGRMTQVGNDVVIANRPFEDAAGIEADGTITIKNTLLTDLSQPDFMFL